MITNLQHDVKYHSKLLDIVKFMFDNFDDYDRYDYQLVDWHIYERLLKDTKNYVIFGYVVRNQLVGFGILDISFQVVAYIWNIYVLPEYRGRGIGSQLKKELELQAGWLGYPIIASELRKDNGESNAMNDKAGWQKLRHKTSKDHQWYYKYLHTSQTRGIK